EAQPGGPLGVDVEQAKVAKGTVIEMLLDGGGNLPRDAAHPGVHGCQRPRDGRLGPPHVLAHGPCPAAGHAGELSEEREAPQWWVPQLEDRPANVDRVHLLVFPGPDQSVMDDLPG